MACWASVAVGSRGKGESFKASSPGGVVDWGVPMVAEGSCGSGPSTGSGQASAASFGSLPLRRQGEGPTLRPALPAHALRRVLEHDPFGRELVADGVGAGEVAGLLGRCAFVDQRLDAGVVVAG